MAGGGCNGAATAAHTNGISDDAHTHEQQQESRRIQQKQLQLQQRRDAAATTPYRFADICYRLRRQVLAFLGKEIPASDELLRNVQSQVRVSVDVIEEALQRYSLEQISISYNGGKDCLVLLILILACLPTCNSPDTVAQPPSNASPRAEPASASRDSPADAPRLAESTDGSPADQPGATSSAPPSSSSTTTTAAAGPSSSPSAASAVPPRAFQAIYIVPPDPFPEVEEFVGTSTATYHLDLARYPLPMRAALDAYLSDRPEVRAIFMGTRRTDPHGEMLTHFTPTDAGWPQFMRIHPVIDWHYAEIWRFIRYFDIPFCTLYNHGFTSLGGTTDTRPNPALATGTEGDSNGTAPSFRPAYELMTDEEERLGRGRQGN